FGRAARARQVLEHPFATHARPGRFRVRPSSRLNVIERSFRPGAWSPGHAPYLRGSTQNYSWEVARSAKPIGGPTAEAAAGSHAGPGQALRASATSVLSQKFVDI